MSQLNQSGYQLSNTEFAKDQQDNTLLSILGGGSLAAGLVVAGDITQRALSRDGSITKSSLSKAAQEFGLDSQTALRVIVGKTKYDRMREKTGDLPKNEGTYPSLRSYAENRTNIGDNDFLYADPTSAIKGEAKNRANRIPNRLTQAAIAARAAFIPSSEDYIAGKREINRRQGLNPEGPRTEVAIARMPAVDGVRDLLGNYPQEVINVRKDLGLDTMKGNIPQRVGSLTGRFASDFINNGIRSWWWLINSPMAIADLASESGTARANKLGLYGSDALNQDRAGEAHWINNENKIVDPNVRAINLDVLADDVDLNSLKNYLDQYPEAKAMRDSHLAELEYKASQGASPAELSYTKNKFQELYKPLYRRRRTNNNLSTLLALPGAIAINAGYGLVNPLGGSEGYKAAVPSEEDPTKTSNILSEIGTKYILGRRGDILPWEEFKKVRPDVSKGEYMAYKGYRYNKKEDWNLFDDGKLNMFQGILKYNNDGIDGSEVFFLGKPLPVNTTLLPAFAAIGGAAAGAALGRSGYLNETGVNASEQDLNSLKEFRDYISQSHPERDLSAIDKQIQTKEPQLKFRKNLVDNIPFRGKLSRTNPVFSGLAGGLGALAAGTGLGHLVEGERRRRKEEEIAERGY